MAQFPRLTAAPTCEQVRGELRRISYTSSPLWPYGYRVNETYRRMSDGTAWSVQYYDIPEDGVNGLRDGAATIQRLDQVRVTALVPLAEPISPHFLGYDSDDPETQQVIWTGDTIPQAADGLTAIPAGVVEIEDTQG